MRSEQPDVTFILGNSAHNCDVEIDGQSSHGRDRPDVHRIDIGGWTADVDDNRELTDDDYGEVQRLRDVGAPLEVHVYAGRDADGLRSEVQTFSEWDVERADE